MAFLMHWDGILRSIVVPYIHDNERMLQHNDAGAHAARICIYVSTQFLEAEHITALAWLAYSPESSTKHVW